MVPNSPPAYKVELSPERANACTLPLAFGSHDGLANPVAVYMAAISLRARPPMLMKVPPTYKMELSPERARESTPLLLGRPLCARVAPGGVALGFQSGTNNPVAVLKAAI